MGRPSLALSIIIGYPKTSSPVYQNLHTDLHMGRSFGFAGFLRFPVSALIQGHSDSRAFTQGSAGQAGW